MIPRFRARVGQADDSNPEEIRGKWFFEVEMGSLLGGEGFERVGLYGPWDTEELAHQKMRAAVRECSELAEKAVTGKVSGEYIDMKTGEKRRWGDEH